MFIVWLQLLFHFHSQNEHISAISASKMNSRSIRQKARLVFAEMLQQ